MTRIINLCFFFILLLIPILFYIYKFVQNTNLTCEKSYVLIIHKYIDVVAKDTLHLTGIYESLCNSHIH